MFPRTWLHERAGRRDAFYLGSNVVAEWLRHIVSSYRRLLIIASPSSTQSAAWTSIKSMVDAAAPDSRYFSSRAQAPVNNTERIVDEVRSEPPDAILAFGGGAAIDTAKGVALLIAEGGLFSDHCTRFVPPDTLHSPPLERAKLPIIAIPTTLSGAELTPGAAGRGAAGKLAVWDPKLAASHVLYDATIMGAMPIRTTASSAFNALAHCAEALYSSTRTPVSDALAERGAFELSSGLARLRRDAGAIDHLLAGAMFAGLAMSTARPALHHALCHAIASVSGIAHADANAVVLPHALRFNREVTLPQQQTFFDAVRRGLFTAGERARVADDALIARLQRIVAVPASLRSLGVEHCQLPEIAEHALRDRGLAFNPIKIEGCEALDPLLHRIWAGDDDKELALGDVAAGNGFSASIRRG